jgi:hypothetical protein
LQNIINNLSDAFIDYKGATKYWDHAVNTPERVELPKKTTQTPSVVKRGRVAQTKKDNAPNKCTKKEKMMPFQKTVNVNQHVIDRHLMNISQSSTQACYRNENASTSENIDALVLENHETSTGIQEIFINYTSYGEVYDCSTTIVNSCFSTIIAEKILANPDPKTMTKCKGRSNWNK